MTRRGCPEGFPDPKKVSCAPIGRDRLFGVALWVAFVLCIAQTISLPVLVTFDGYWYARLAEVLGTARFAGEWDYLRTPLFPVLLKLSFWLFGRQPLAVCVVQFAFVFGGICLLGATLRRLGRPVEAAIVVLLLSFFPTLITYEHALLTEAGTFFLLYLSPAVALLYAISSLNARKADHEAQGATNRSGEILLFVVDRDYDG